MKSPSLIVNKMVGLLTDFSTKPVFSSCCGRWLSDSYVEVQGSDISIFGEIDEKLEYLSAKVDARMTGA